MIRNHKSEANPDVTKANDEGHPSNNDQVFEQPAPNAMGEYLMDRNLKTELEPYTKITADLLDRFQAGPNRSQVASMVIDTVFEAERLHLRMKDRLRRLERQLAVAEKALADDPDNPTLKENLALLQTLIATKKGYVRSAERVLECLALVADFIPEND